MTDGRLWPVRGMSGDEALLGVEEDAVTALLLLLLASLLLVPPADPSPGPWTEGGRLSVPAAAVVNEEEAASRA